MRLQCLLALQPALSADGVEWTACPPPADPGPKLSRVVSPG